MDEVAASNSTAIIRPPPFVIDSTDRAGVIIVVTTFCLVSCWVLFGIRLHIRLRVNGPWKLDDTCVAIATILSTARSAVVYNQVQKGYGKSSELLSPGADVEIGKLVFADTILYFLALYFAKCAVLLLCQRMTPKREHYIAISAIFAFCSAWAIASILLITIKCNPGHAWVDLAGQCVDIAARWKSICALDVITEISIFFCSISLVVGLHMSWTLKALVVTAFAIRLPTTIFSGLHLISVLKEISAPDPTLAGAVTSAWRQFELDFAIVACTLSSLGAFLKPFDSEVGPSRSDSHPIGSNRGFPMNSLQSGNHSSKRNQEPSSEVSINLPILRPDPANNTATATFTSLPSDRASVESNDSKKGIIMKKQWTVDHGLRKYGSRETRS